jgi:hypothetical protein
MDEPRETDPTILLRARGLGNAPYFNIVQYKDGSTCVGVIRATLAGVKQFTNLSRDLFASSTAPKTRLSLKTRFGDSHMLL